MTESLEQAVGVGVQWEEAESTPEDEGEFCHDYYTELRLLVHGFLCFSFHITYLVLDTSSDGILLINLKKCGFIVLLNFGDMPCGVSRGRHLENCKKKLPKSNQVCKLELKNIDRLRIFVVVKA